MKKFVALIVVIAALSLSACVTTEPVQRNSLRPSTASVAEIKQAKEEASAQMKDPSSVQFRNVAGYKRGNPGFTVLCGEMNGKNSFGGYTGFKHFTYLSGHLFLNQPAEGCAICENPFNKNWNEACKP